MFLLAVGVGDNRRDWKVVKQRECETVHDVADLVKKMVKVRNGIQPNERVNMCVTEQKDHSLLSEYYRYYLLNDEAAIDGRDLLLMKDVDGAELARDLLPDREGLEAARAISEMTDLPVNVRELETAKAFMISLMKSPSAGVDFFTFVEMKAVYGSDDEVKTARELVRSFWRNHVFGYAVVDHVLKAKGKTRLSQEDENLLKRVQRMFGYFDTLFAASCLGQPIVMGKALIVSWMVAARRFDDLVPPVPLQLRDLDLNIAVERDFLRVSKEAIAAAVNASLTDDGGGGRNDNNNNNNDHNKKGEMEGGGEADSTPDE